MAGHIPPPRKNIGARIRADLADEIRDFVRDQAGKPLFLTVTSFLEEAAEAHLKTLRKRLAADPLMQGRKVDVTDNHLQR
jgi:hypothetical protein